MDTSRLPAAPGPSPSSTEVTPPSPSSADPASLLFPLWQCPDCVSNLTPLVRHLCQCPDLPPPCFPHCSPHSLLWPQHSWASVPKNCSPPLFCPLPDSSTVPDMVGHSWASPAFQSAWTLLLRLKTHQHSLSSPNRQRLTCPAVSQTPANGVINFPRQQGAVQVNGPYQLKDLWRVPGFLSLSILTCKVEAMSTVS